METWIEEAMTRGWQIFSKPAGKTIGIIYESGEGPSPFQILVLITDRVTLAGLNGKRYPSLPLAAAAIAEHLNGPCRII